LHYLAPAVASQGEHYRDALHQTHYVVRSTRRYGPGVRLVYSVTFVQAVFGGKAFFNQYYVYVIGPVVGGALGALAYDFLARPKVAAEQETVEAMTTERAAATTR
jgi:hypothetical protein